jgi:hypothetical protein
MVNDVIDLGGIYVEITPSPPDVIGGANEGFAGGTDDLLERLDGLGDKVGVICSRLQTKALDAMHGVAPDTFEIEFGVTLSGEAGIPLVTKGSAECNFVVKATWNLGEKS